ncbi:MAG: DnaJ domain-containing protein [Rhodomicrobium sp.]|nr:DnaJ domain-containing protein [Rhodomicrobium sp.]
MNSGAENYYAILGVSQTAEDEIIKNAFREKAKTYHPDYNPDDAEAERRFKQINTAYEALKDPSRRKAYDEWLRFARTRKKTSRRQWRRLAALFALLLLGPSIILSWLTMSGDTPTVETAEKPVAERTAAPDKPIAAKSADADIKPSNGSRSGDARRLDQASNAADADNADGKEKPEEAKALAGDVPERPGPQLAASLPDKPAPPTVAKTAESDAALPADEKPAEEPPQTSKAAEPEPGVEPPANREPDPVETTQALPSQTAGLNGPDAEQGDGAPPVPESHPNRRLASNAESFVPGGARNAARVIAALKEPEGASGGSSPEGQQQGRQSSISDERLLDSFSDCDDCPVMSLAGRPDRSRNAEGIAISQGEITLAQWSVCVREGACSPYPRAGGNPSDPVIGLSPRDAGNYAYWLSETTGQSYRIVMPILPSSGRSAVSARARRCSEEGGGRRASGWDWLDDDAPKQEECPPSQSEETAAGKARGFRVARRVRADR